jgi:hypothetical protein
LFQKIAWFVLAFFAMDGIYNLAGAPVPPVPPGPQTPKSLVMTLNSVDITTDPRREYKTILNNPTSVDVVGQTGLPGSVFGRGFAGFDEYKAVRLTLSATGRYSGINPCTGIYVSDAEIQLPGSENGQAIINYMVPHPVLGLQAGYRQMQSIKLGGDPVDFRIVFSATHSVVCSSSAGPLRTISGDLTQMTLPQGVALYQDPAGDSSQDEIAVANASPNHNRITIYHRTDNGNPLPLQSLEGDVTGLSNPIGIYVDADHNEIGVANNGNNSITIYDRQAIIDTTTGIANVSPKYPPVMGDQTGLNSPGMIAIYLDPQGDPTKDEIIVANGGNNSVTFYNRMDVINGGNVLPIRTLTGPNTDLDVPCGLYADPSNNQIGVANNGNNSITIYDRQTMIDNTDPTTKIANASPLPPIIGPSTDINNPCGLYVDQDEIGVANNGNNSITIYSRLAAGNTPPIRSIQGDTSGINRPWGIYVDTINDEIGVTNLNHDSLTIHKRDDPTVQLKRLPDLILSSSQQALFPEYFYSGAIDKNTGMGDHSSINYDGYHFAWSVTDARIRQTGDASSGLLLPPSDIIFGLTDGRFVSNLSFACPQLTPFITLSLSTNCPPPPLILSPLPAAEADYRVAAILFAVITITKMHVNSSPLQESEFPRPIPTLSLASDGTIQGIDWKYVDVNDLELPSPLIYSQQFSITLRRPFDKVSSCYQQVQGNSAQLVFSSGSFPPDIRSLDVIKNNKCDISINDVNSLVFTYTDAFSNAFVFTWQFI